MEIRRHNNQGWPYDMLDKDWIAECGAKGWAIISGDKKIAIVPEERQAVIDAKAKVFMFDENHETHTEDWAAALLVARQRLIEIVENTNGPFFVTIKPCKVHGHITLPDFIPGTGSGWKVKEQQIEAVVTATTLQVEKKKRPRQQLLNFETVICTSIILIGRGQAHCDLCARLFGISMESEEQPKSEGAA